MFENQPVHDLSEYQRASKLPANTMVCFCPPVANLKTFNISIYKDAMDNNH